MEHLIDTCWGDDSEHQEYLNQKAQEGWELVNVIQEKESTFYKYFFKKTHVNKDLQHHKDTTVGLYATDKEPEKLFEEIFVHLIEKIGMDGEKTFSPMDYECYNEYFKKGINLLMWRIS